MKKLKKILILNWLYYSKELVELDDITFLTGNTGSGKSTFIDALQIVLLGELNARNFNKAANESSQRTLDGYLRADMDDKNPKSRRGKDFSSYIACEFWDDITAGRFVLGVVFDCRGDGRRREQFFTYDGAIPAYCFLQEKQPMDIAALRGWLKEQPEARAAFYDSNKKYRDDILAKWNVHSEQLFRMLKMAISFKPIVDIQDFITKNVCDIPETPDIEAMQQNIRDYKRHEALAQRQEEKLDALTNIAKLFRETQSAIDRLQIQRFIVLWAEKEDIEEQILRLEKERTERTDEITQKKSLTEALTAEIKQTTQRKEQLIADRANNDVYQERIRLEAREHELEREKIKILGGLQKTALEVKREAQKLCALCERMENWPELETLKELREQAERTRRVYLPFCDCTETVFANAPAPFHSALQQTSQLIACIQSASHRVRDLVAGFQEQREQNVQIIANLKRGVKDYPGGLLSLRAALQQKLTAASGKTISIDILADVLEIADGEEAWRGAVEGYLHTQKFYLLVEPIAYEQALVIYDQIKRDYKDAFGLVDIGKLREKEQLNPWDDSLAQKVKTENPLARSYVDYLLGRVVCCTHVTQIRRHRTAITADGMLYQGYVARPIAKARMDDSFIGQRAIAHRLDRLWAQQAQLEKKLALWSPLQSDLELRAKQDFLFAPRFVQSELPERQAQHIQMLELQKEKERVSTRFSELDLMWVNRINLEINRLEQEIQKMNGEKDSLIGRIGGAEQRIHALEYDELPARYQRLNAKEDSLQEDFSEPYRDTTGLPRYRQELTRLKRPSAVVKNFGDSIPQSQKSLGQATDKLFAARADYVRQFQPCAFRVETMDNDEYEQERALLAESELPKYREKIRYARESALEQFQNDFLAKLKSGIEQVEGQVKNLNRALQQMQFGTDRYQFRVDKNPDYAEYYAMIMAPELMEGEGGLFTLSFQQKYGSLIESLFNLIAVSDDTQLNARKQSELQANIGRYTDFRTYLKFDLETTDQNGSKQLLSQTLNTKSGGETQTPFYIAVLASFAQLYRTGDLSSFGNTMRLVIFDEAFNKMDSERIIESIRLLRKMNLQALICTPPDKLQDIMPEVDRTLLVGKEKYTMRILPYHKERVL